MLRIIFQKMLIFNEYKKGDLDIVYLKFNQESQIDFSNDHLFQDKFKFETNSQLKEEEKSLCTTGPDTYYTESYFKPYSQASQGKL